MSFIDDLSSYTTIIYLIKSKDEVASKLKKYIVALKNKFGKTPKMFKFDNGGEYCNTVVKEILRKNRMFFKQLFHIPRNRMM